jgi:hypothetical protein
MATLGVFSLAAPKQKSNIESYLTVTLASGDTPVFHVEGTPESKVRAVISSAQQRMAAWPKPSLLVKTFSSTPTSFDEVLADAAARTPKAKQPPAAIAEATFELANYDGGLPFRPQPEAKGTLVIPGSGKTVAQWQLHWGSDLATEHQFTHGGLARYPITVEATGPTSCRATICDAQDPSLVGHFDLPTTAVTAVEAALLARAKLVEQGRRAMERANSAKPLPAAPSPAPAQLSMADELAKIADLHDKGVLSDEEFASAKAKLLSQ